MEQHRIGDVLGLVAQMFADERIVITQFVAQDDRLSVFLQGFQLIAMQRVHRHGEITQTH